MPEKIKAKRASDLLWNAWRDQAVMDRLPDDCRPTSRTEAYAVQQHIELRSNTTLYGWKIAACSRSTSGVPASGRPRSRRDSATARMRSSVACCANALRMSVQRSR